MFHFVSYRFIFHCFRKFHLSIWSTPWSQQEIHRNSVSWIASKYAMVMSSFPPFFAQKSRYSKPEWPHASRNKPQVGTQLDEHVHEPNFRSRSFGLWEVVVRGGSAAVTPCPATSQRELRRRRPSSLISADLTTTTNTGENPVMNWMGCLDCDWNYLILQFMNSWTTSKIWPVEATLVRLAGTTQSRPVVWHLRQPSFSGVPVGFRSFLTQKTHLAGVKSILWSTLFRMMIPVDKDICELGLKPAIRHCFWFVRGLESFQFGNKWHKQNVFLLVNVQFSVGLKSMILLALDLFDLYIYTVDQKWFWAWENVNLYALMDTRSRYRTVWTKDVYRSL
jgi:hypothetical protein